MSDLIAIYAELKPWIIIFIFIWLCLKLVTLARERKGIALAFGIFTQMFLPDPKAQQTIEAIVQRKEEAKKQQDENGEPKKDETKN
ncbi:hypothetical protein [Paraglaciecola sp.]|uniref:hypothetical protein n=1 Tax=Paraglaciecola sp. TaxID=1920173 RepID=UPI00273D6C18|nr:hypothetical protein [Paraglaciecola sp.]MDP5030297.1 hypothetical protein [Paraglaciecola sp.]